MNDIQEIAIKMCEKVKNYSVGTEFTIAELVKSVDESYDFSDFENTFEIMEQFLNKCQQENIFIENTQSGQILGMPWDYTHIKK